MKIMINPKYEYLREYVERIPKDFETIGTVIHSGRNLIKMITVDGLDINVKRYTIPPLINRLFFRFQITADGILQRKADLAGIACCQLCPHIHDLHAGQRVAAVALGQAHQLSAAILRSIKAACIFIF